MVENRTNLLNIYIINDESKKKHHGRYYQYGRTMIDLKITGRCGLRALCVYQMIDEEYLYYYDNLKDRF